MEATHTELTEVGFTEGPAVTAGGRLYVTSIQAGTVVEARDGAVLATHRIGGGPSGTDGSLCFTDPIADPTVNGPVAAPVYAAIDRVDCGAGSFPTNCCFGGPDDGTLFITVAKAGAVLRLRPGVRGLPLYS